MIEGTEPMVDGQRGDLKQYAVTLKMADDLDTRFTYHAPKEDQLPRYARIRNEARHFAATIIALTPPSREQSLALTHLEEVSMWANAAIARNEK